MYNDPGGHINDGFRSTLDILMCQSHLVATYVYWQFTRKANSTE